MPRPEPEERVYSLNEARAQLPATVKRLEQIAELRTQMRAWGSAAEGMVSTAEKPPDLGDLLDAINIHLRELSEAGIVVRDLGSGIIDFPGLDEDGPVYWCYRLGEPDILYWHRQDEGFASRKRLPETP